MKTNPFGGHQITPKQQTVNYKNTRGRYNYSNTSNIQRGRGARGQTFPRGSQNTRGQQKIPTQVVKNSVINAEISIIKTVYSPALQKIKFARNAPNGVILLKYAGPRT